eukprot:13650615-Alexandrium_andersonii.AAC.1
MQALPQPMQDAVGIPATPVKLGVEAQMLRKRLRDQGGVLRPPESILDVPHAAHADRCKDV